MTQPYYTRRGKIVLWLWRNLPLSGHVKAVVAWLANVRYAVGVVAIVHSADGNVLVQRHTYRREGYEWGLPGGWVKGRESMERAVAREVQEETGYRIVLEKLVAVHSGFAVPRMTIYFLAHIASGTFRPSDEVSACEWRHPDHLGRILPADRTVIKQALAGMLR